MSTPHFFLFLGAPRHSQRAILSPFFGELRSAPSGGAVELVELESYFRVFTVTVANSRLG